MKIAYFDCFSGASGNMILGALVDVGLDVAQLEAELAKLHLHEYQLRFEKRSKHAITATHLEVEVHEPTHHHSRDDHDHAHPHGSSEEHTHAHHRHLSDILALLDSSGLEEGVKKKARQIFVRLAEAEARIHNTRTEEVHLHEVSGVDSIVDIVGSVIGLHLLGIEEIHTSPIALGTGFVRCAHGMMPLPAPGTLELLKEVPVRPTDIRNELTTPTGAAILSTLTQEFGPMPEMIVESAGYGAGSRDLKERPNLLRVCIGTKQSAPLTDQITILETNIDDMPAEILGYVSEKLFELGALDVFTVPVFMKKNRPATLLTIIAESGDAQKFVDCVLRETTTFGVRFYTSDRVKLAREVETVTTPYGDIRIKKGYHRGQLLKAVPEYADCSRLARECGIPFRTVYQAAEQAATRTHSST